MSEQAARELWASDDAMTTTLVVLGADRYGTLALGWNAETWAAEVYDDHRVVLPDGNLSRLMVGCLLHTEPDRFYRDPAFFELACRLMSAPGFRVQHDGLADAAEVTWGVVEAYRLSPPPSGFSESVRAYAREAAREAGLSRVPAALHALKLVAPGDLGLPAYDHADPVHRAESAGRRAADRRVRGLFRENAARLAGQLEGLELESGDASGYAKAVRTLAG